MKIPCKICVRKSDANIMNNYAKMEPKWRSKAIKNAWKNHVENHHGKWCKTGRLNSPGGIRGKAQGGKEGTPPLDYLNNYLHKNTKHLNRTGSNSLALTRTGVPAGTVRIQSLTRIPPGQGYGRPWCRGVEGREIDAKNTKNRSQNEGNCAKSTNTPSQMVQQSRKVGKNRVLKLYGELPAKGSVYNSAREAPVRKQGGVKSTFWAKMAPQGCLFGNPENRKWHQNRPVEKRPAPGPSKNGPRERFWKKMENRWKSGRKMGGFWWAKTIAYVKL